MDSSFDPGQGIWVSYDSYTRQFGPIGQMALAPSGQILLSGGFNSIDGAAVQWLARLNSDLVDHLAQPDLSLHLEAPLRPIPRN